MSDVSKDANSEKHHQNGRVDEVDLQLIDLLMSGHTPKEGAAILKKPVSTIQRRARLLIDKKMLRPSYELGYSQLGIKRGFLHVYLEDGNVEETVDNLLKRAGVYSAGAHLGNSDVVAFFVFKDSREVLDLISSVKDMDAVEKVVWSEEVYSKSTSPKLDEVIGGDGRQ